jgi:hypothetical protein
MTSEADEIAALNELIAEQRRMLRNISAARQPSREDAVLQPARRKEASPSPREPRPAGSTPRGGFVASSGWYAAEIERLTDELTIANQRVLLAENRAQTAESEVRSLVARVRHMELQVEAAIRGRNTERDHILEVQHSVIEQRGEELAKANALIEALTHQLSLNRGA